LTHDLRSFEQKLMRDKKFRYFQEFVGQAVTQCKGALLASASSITESRCVQARVCLPT